MTQDTVRQLEENITRNKAVVELDHALGRLLKNADFKKVISEGYLKHEAIRLVHLRGDPLFQKPEKQASLMLQIDAIAALAEYFRTIEQMAAVATKEIESDEHTREEIAAEELAQ